MNIPFFHLIGHGELKIFTSRGYWRKEYQQVLDDAFLTYRSGVE